MYGPALESLDDGQDMSAQVSEFSWYALATLTKMY